MTKRVPILWKKSFEPHIVDCDYFTVDKVVLDGQRMKKIFGEIDKTSFASLLVLDGAGKVQSGEEKALGVSKPTFPSPAPLPFRARVRYWS